MPIFFAVLITRQGSFPRVAMRIFLNTLVLRGELAWVRFAHHAIWLRRNVHFAAVFATVRNQYLLEHQELLELSQHEAADEGEVLAQPGVVADVERRRRADGL